jgi:uncharacterized membrane protein (DUF2068 family)
VSRERKDKTQLVNPETRETQGKRSPHAAKARIGPLRLIAIFKLVKALILVTLLAAILHLLPHDPSQTLLPWALTLHVDPNNRYVRALLATLLHMNEKRQELLIVGTALYALLFTLEGVGLWLERTWAEYLSLVATAGFLPVELYELLKHRSLIKGVVLVLNLVIVLYLALHVRHRRRVDEKSSAH